MILQTASNGSVPSSPLIKWPGGKRALIPELLKHTPINYKNYYEPFFGGGALFFFLQPASAFLSDLNADLINCYKLVKEKPEEIISALGRYKNTEEYYYRVRSSAPRTEIYQAARLLYLTRLSFNGIHRVNLRGRFNVPYGKKTHLECVDSALLRSASTSLKNARLMAGDFEETTVNAGPGDFVYFDPPYTVAHANNGFVKYNEHIFSWADQVRLAEHARRLAKKGCHVLVSNADHKSVLELYEDAACVTIWRHSVIAASSSHRRKITESLFIFGRNQID